jgi:hypothetical protein
MVLSKNPIQGGSVVVRVSFRDEAGQVYVPVEGTCFYALLARNDHKGDGFWSVVKKWVPVTSASIVDIVCQGEDLELLPGCNLKRRILLQWRYLRGGEGVVGRDMVDFELTPLPVTDPPLDPPPVLPPPPDDPVGPIEDTIDGLEGYDSNLNLSVKVAGGFVNMSPGPVLAANVAGGLLTYVYSFSAPGEVQLVGLHGDTHVVSEPLFRATVRVAGGKWTLVRIDPNLLGLEAGTVFNFYSVS